MQSLYLLKISIIEQNELKIKCDLNEKLIAIKFNKIKR